MGNSCCKRKSKRSIVLLLVGLDNAGKTAAAKGLAGESFETVVPTVGFSVINLQYSGFAVKIFDLGGRPDIRGIWDRYFVDAHGVIFVVDSSDYARLDEASAAFKDLVSHEKIAGKPVLVLANKQDSEDALDEIDLVERLQIERVVNAVQCPAMVESCSAVVVTDSKPRLDRGIENGYAWLMNSIVNDYKRLNERVRDDVELQEKLNHQNRLRIIERLKRLDAETEELQESPVAKRESDVSLQSETESFPHVYNENLEDASKVQRPKSAVAAVRQQLEIDSLPKKPSNASFLPGRTNKVGPAVIFDSQSRPASAKSTAALTPAPICGGDFLNRAPFQNGGPDSFRSGPNGDNKRINGEVFALTDSGDLGGSSAVFVKPRLPPIAGLNKDQESRTTELSIQVHRPFSPGERSDSTRISTIEID